MQPCNTPNLRLVNQYKGCLCFTKSENEKIKEERKKSIKILKEEKKHSPKIIKEIKKKSNE